MAEEYEVVFQFPENLTRLGSDWSMVKERGRGLARLKRKNKYKNEVACTLAISERRPAQGKERE